MGTRQQALDPDTIVPWLAALLNRPRPRGVVAGVADDDCGVIRFGKTLVIVSVDFVNATPIVEQLRLGPCQTPLRQPDSAFTVATPRR